MTLNIARIAALAAALALGACQSSNQSQPTTTASAAQSAAVRSSGETAPADLQLLCASEVSTRVGSDDVLPVSSARTEDGNYTVDLTVSGGRTATCIVDADGTVQSVVV